MQEPVLVKWLASARLNGMRALMRPKEMLTPVQIEARARQRAAMPAALANLTRLLAPAGATSEMVDA